MKRNILMLIGMLALGISTARSQTVLLNSWEGSPEGWTILESAWTSDGFSTNGATQGTNSWGLTTTGVDYGSTLQGPSSTNVTAVMAGADSVSMDILVSTNPVNAGAEFNWGIQIDLEVDQPGGAGLISVDGGNYTGDIFNPQLDSGTENTVTWSIPQAVRTALDENPNLPTYLIMEWGGGGGGTVYLDNLRANLFHAQLSVRELWDDLPGEGIPAEASVFDDSSSVGFVSSDPWVVNSAEINNCKLMAFRPGFPNDPLSGSDTIGLPGSLDNSYGSMVQDNGLGEPTLWTGGDFMTRQLDPAEYINFQATGEYWFTMTIANSTSSLDAPYVSNPASGAGGIGFADADTTNADFVAVGVTGLSLLLGPGGVTNASKSVYISQGTLGQPGDPSSVTDTPPSATSLGQTNFTGGPYYIDAFDTNSATVGTVEGNDIVVLGHLKTYGNGTATLDAKYYTVTGGSPWNYNLDTNPATITYDCSYSFNFGGTMNRMLLFENGQFPFYVFGFRAGTNFSQVVGLDPGRIQVSPLTNTFVGYAINMTNLAEEANAFSFATPPDNYGTLNYQWYQGTSPIVWATNQYLNIASASQNDTNMPAGTDAGVYTSVATDPSGTWESVTNSVAIGVTPSVPPTASIQMFHNQNMFLITFSEPNLAGVTNTSNYVFTGGIVATNVTVISTSSNTEVYVTTTPLPLGTKITVSISDVTNVVGGVLVTTNYPIWTDLIQTGVANWNAWQYPALTSLSDYYDNFVPNNQVPPILQSEALNSWEGPASGVTIPGTDGYVGDGFGDKIYGWFIPPVTTNYVFYVSADDGCRLSLSTNSSPTTVFPIAVDSLWSGPDEWTNVDDNNPSDPHRGDGTENAIVVAGSGAYLWDNSVAEGATNLAGAFIINPATADEQNRSDQFIVAYWDSSGLTGQPGEPAGATNQANWAAYGNNWSPVANGIPASMTNFWPNVDANGQALIHLQAGQMYYMVLEHVQIGGGYDESVTYKIAGQPDPNSGVPGTSTNGAPSALTGSVIAGTVPFTPSVSIAQTGSGPVINYTGVLLAGSSLSGITNVVAQSSAGTAISLGGPSQYVVPLTNSSMFYRTGE